MSPQEVYTTLVDASGKWEISAGALWIVFGSIIFLFTLATILLYHHWNEYITHSKKLETAKQLYMRVSFFLLGIMVVTVLFYTL